MEIEFLIQVVHHLMEQSIFRDTQELLEELCR